MRMFFGTTVLVMVLLSAAVPSSAQPIVGCAFDPSGPGDLIDRAFYVPNFPASSIGRVQLQISSHQPGEHVFSLTARDSAYDGPVIGTATASVLLSGDGLAYDPVVSFNFYGAAVTAGHTVTFTTALLRGPAGAYPVFNLGLLGTCSSTVWETEDATPPLSTQRRQYMGVTIYAPEPADYTTSWVPVASHGTGAGGVLWRSDVKLLNRGVVPANVTLRLHEGGNPTRSVTVPGAGSAKNQMTINDVVAWIDPSFSGSAAIEVMSDQALTVESRNYTLVPADATCTPSGTFGQLYDAYTPEMGLIADQTAYLVGLVENAAFRTNIGLTNIGSTAAQATVTLLDAAGTVLASYNVSLAPGEWKQAYRPFNGYAHRSDLAGCYAKVTVTAGNGVIAYASVVDWLTSDATTVIGKI